MKFITTVSNWFRDWDLTVKIAEKAADLGFWGVGMPDHYLWGPNQDDATLDSYATLDSWFALSWLASKISRIHVGTIVTPITFRPPAVLAKMVSTLDVISNGRTFLGVGAGWSQREFEAYSQWDAPGTRVSKTEEGLRLILALWTEDRVDFQGKYYHSIGGVLKPKPVQKPHPPLFFGGVSPRMLRLAGKYGDVGDVVFIPPWIKLSFAEAEDVVIESTKKRSDLWKPSLAIGSPAPPSLAIEGAKYDPALFRNAVAEAEENGCDYYVLQLPQEDVLGSLERFGKDILSSYR